MGKKYHTRKSYPYFDAREKKHIKRIERICLRCDEPFMAEGKFNRICPFCTKINQEIARTCIYPDLPYERLT